MSHVKRQLQLMILKLNYKLLLPLKGRELDVHITMHGRNPYPAGHKHYGWCTYCSKSVNIKAGSNEFKKHSLTKAHKRNEKSILSSTSLTSLINQHDVV